MKTAIIHFLIIVLPFWAIGQNQHLLGTQPLESLKQAPYSEWYSKGYDAYQTNEKLLPSITKMTKKNLKFKVFFGSWCGDTQRELPKFVKMLHQAGFKDNQIELIGVDNAPNQYKQSPKGEEIGWHIYRVPTFIVIENNKELGRIVEYPVLSFERDLMTILHHHPYQPNYAGYQRLSAWIIEGLLADKNTNVRGLANQLRGVVHQDGELNAMGYVLLGQKKMKEAIKVLQINTQLFPNVVNCYDSLAEAYLQDNQKENALAYYEYALKLDPTNKDVQKAVESLKKDK
jgi:tetratricopeptide (TPR) repeat protein